MLQSRMGRHVQALFPAVTVRIDMNDRSISTCLALDGTPVNFPDIGYALDR